MVTKTQAIKNWERQINSLKKQNEYSRNAIKQSDMLWEKKEYRQVIASNKYIDSVINALRYPILKISIKKALGIIYAKD